MCLVKNFYWRANQGWPRTNEQAILLNIQSARKNHCEKWFDGRNCMKRQRKYKEADLVVMDLVWFHTRVYPTTIVIHKICCILVVYTMYSEQINIFKML